MEGAEGKVFIDCQRPFHTGGRRMSHKNAFLVCALSILLTLGCVAITDARPAAASQPSQVELGNISGATVTLYYYNPETGGKGAKVPLPGNQNPQQVEWDYTKAAPGTYTFYNVPHGTYYLEAVHNNHTWFTKVIVGEGTTTANVAIPLYNDSGFFPSPSPQATASVTPTEIPTASPEPTPMPRTMPSPGMTTLCVLAGLTLVTLYAICRRD